MESNPLVCYLNSDDFTPFKLLHILSGLHKYPVDAYSEPFTFLFLILLHEKEGNISCWEMHDNLF